MYEYAKGSGRRAISLFPAMHLPLRLRNTHQQLLVPDRDPAREHLHRVLEVGLEQDVARAVYQGGGDGVEDVEGAVVGRVGVVGRGCVERGVLGVTEQHEDVPDAELSGKGDGVVEEGQVPAGAVGGGGDVEVVLYGGSWLVSTVA